MNLLNQYFNNSIERVTDNFFNKTEYGELLVEFPHGDNKTYKGAKTGYNADIKLNNYNLFLKLLKKGSIGFAESYMDEDFETNDLSRLLLFAQQNELSYLKKKQAKWLYDSIIKIRHYLNKNTLHQSKKNISHHYDLGNNFYKYWLDESMTYSSALFENNNQDLNQAQLKKYSVIAEPHSLNENSQLLEIGCGWGGFSIFVAKKYGATVKAITISKEQFDYVSEKISKEKLNEKVNVEIRDYRDIKDKYTNIVSIEMFEAVGKEYWELFFDKIKNSLKDSGLATMQIITINESRAEKYQNNPDFIQQYIFPGGVLPSKKQLIQINDSIGLKFKEYRCLKNSYVKTLNHWEKKFKNSWNQISNQGFSDRFKKMWEYYFCYCQAGFISGSTEVSQFILRK